MLGIDAADGLVVDAEALDDARPVLFDENVGILDELVEDLSGVIVLEVQADAALIAAHGVEGVLLLRAVKPVGPGDGSLDGSSSAAQGELLDFEDVGAEVSEDHGAEGARGHAGEVDYFYAVKGESHF